MSYKMVVRTFGTMLLGAVLLSALGLLAPQLFMPDVLRLPPAVSADPLPTAAQAETFDSSRAADISAMRWQAMAQFYADHDMLTRANPTDAELPEEPAAQQHALDETYHSLELLKHDAALNSPAEYRWRALAEVLEDQGVFDPNTVDPDEATAYRWLAMARFYEQHDMLTRREFDYEQAAENLAYRWNAMARWYERMGMLNEKSASQHAPQ